MPLEIDDITQSQSVESIQLLDTINRDDIEAVVALIRGSANPVETARAARDHLAALLNGRGRVRAQHIAVYDIESDVERGPAHKLLDAFMPNTVEKAAAWAAVLGLIYMVVSSGRESNITVNNYFIDQSQHSFEQQLIEIHQENNVCPAEPE